MWTAKNNILAIQNDPTVTTVSKKGGSCHINVLVPPIHLSHFIDLHKLFNDLKIL